MADKFAKDVSSVARYKAAAALRRAERRALKQDSAQVERPIASMITVAFGSGAKPLSAFGGISKVVGPSRISIPEYKAPKK